MQKVEDRLNDLLVLTDQNLDKIKFLCRSKLDLSSDQSGTHLALDMAIQSADHTSHLLYKIKEFIIHEH